MSARPRIIGTRVYEDFQPSSDFLQEEACETLTINLPEFSKDQIRVQMDDRSGFVLISGERPIGNNKWNRFRKSVRVPTNCNAKDIQAKFENAVLKVTMPIKTADKKQEQLVSKSDQTQFSETPKPIPTPPPPPPQPIQQSIPDRKPIPPLSQKPTPAMQSPPSKKPVIEQKPTAALLTPPSRKPINEPIPVGMRQPQPSEKLKTTPAPQHPLIEKITESKPKPIPQASVSQERPFTRKETNIVQKEIDLKTGKAENEESGAQKIIKEKKLIDGLSATSEKQEKNREMKESQRTKEGIKGNVTHGAEDQKSGSRIVATELGDSKPYILNMAAAVLVVVALVVYIKYTVKTPW